jgi:hypothetical protein
VCSGVAEFRGFDISEYVCRWGRIAGRAYRLIDRNRRVIVWVVVVGGSTFKRSEAS